MEESAGTGKVEESEMWRRVSLEKWSERRRSRSDGAFFKCPIEIIS